ncbi:MAG TPA: DUF2231 domain-containing protein [Nocardioidaceae bacterium]|nr:DUF2231 domain-containing protein [Nocardioidaceae bacterium]
MELGGLPLHPLVVHAAVVFTPVAALLAIVFAVVPRWRWLTRWPAGLAALASLGAVWLAKVSGKSFLEERPELAPLVKVHEQRGDLLGWFVIGFFVVVAAAVFALGSESPLPSGRGARAAAAPWVDKLLPILVVLASLAVLVLVVMTGDSGSRAVWGR